MSSSGSFRTSIELYMYCMKCKCARRKMFIIRDAHQCRYSTLAGSCNVDDEKSYGNEYWSPLIGPRPEPRSTNKNKVLRKL